MIIIVIKHVQMLLVTINLGCQLDEFQNQPKHSWFDINVRNILCQIILSRNNHP